MLLMKENTFIHPETGAGKDNGLQERMIMALQGLKSEAELTAIKKEYQEKYPDQLEGVEALFAVRPMLQLSARLERFRPVREGETMPPELRKMLVQMAEYNYLLTHYVWKGGENREFLDLFWQAFEKSSRNEEELKNISRRKKGILTQVATMKVFERSGMLPELSLPENDAMNMVDLWADTRHTQAVQVKTGSGKAEIIETDHIPAVTIQFGPKGREALYASKEYEEARNFRAKVNKYRANQPDLKGYLVVIPYSQIDQATGEPNSELVEALRAKMGMAEKNAA